MDPDINYPTLYRFLVEVWIFMGLAWLSLFFSWNVYMVVEAHKVLKKRRYQRRHRLSLEELRHHEETQVSVCSRAAEPKPSAIDIFNYLTVKEEDYCAIIKKIGAEPKKEKKKKKVTIQEDVPRSKSCNDILNDMGIIMTLEQSPRLKRHLSFSGNVFTVVSESKESMGSTATDEESQNLLEDSGEDQSPEGSSPEQEGKVKLCSWDNIEPDPTVSQSQNGMVKLCSWDNTEPDPTVSQSQNGTVKQEDRGRNQEEVEDGAGSRFIVFKVSEEALLEEEEEGQG